MAAANSAVVAASDLKRRLGIAERRGKLVALGLIAPLFLFIIASFLVPIAIMLSNAVYDPDIADNLPNTVRSLKDWTGPEPPEENTYAALVGDLQAAEKSKTVDLIGKRLNYEISGMRSKIRTNARKARSITSPPFKEQVTALDPIFSDVRVLVRRQARRGADHGLLSPEYTRSADERRGPDRRRREGQGGLQADPRPYDVHKPARHASHVDPRFSGGLRSRQHAAAHCQSPDDPRAAAVLDLASGAHDGMVRHPAGQRAHQRFGRCAWHNRRAAAADLQPLRNGRRHDPHPAAVHAAADLRA